MSAKAAIDALKKVEKVTPRQLTGKDLKAYNEWVMAFATGELDLKRSRAKAAAWLLENTSLNCCNWHLKSCLSADVRKAQNDSEKRDKGRARAKRTNTTRRTKGTA